MREFGAIDDAQESFNNSATTCMTSIANKVLTCSNMIFGPNDVGKTIQIPGAGNATGITLPTPIPTLQTTIMSISSTCSGGTTQCINLAAQPMTAVTVGVTWGTDNSTAFNAAAAACPSPSNIASLTSGTLGGFSSKACVLLIPNSGASGTGDYMFGEPVVISNATSIQIIGMGNSSKAAQPPSLQSGVRLVTAMPITILTIGIGPTVTAKINNYGSFQLSNITFRDTSSDGPLAQFTNKTIAGQAIGGLLMYNMSEAVISYCDFENFDGQQFVDSVAAGGTTLINYSYGMKADPGAAFDTLSMNKPVTGFNNNILLIHDKGANNSIFYDSSLPGQDGPIVIGGDIFPRNILNTVPTSIPLGGNLPSACYGFITVGPVRMYGTHFDVQADAALTPVACVGVLMERGGIVNAKFEDGSGSHVSIGVVLNGGGTPPVGTTTSVSRSLGGVVTIDFSGTAHHLVPGEVITLQGFSDNTFNGTFRVAGIGMTTGHNLAYYYQTGAMSSASLGSVTGTPQAIADLDLVLSNLGIGVQIKSGSSNNRVFAVTDIDTTPVTDAGTGDSIQVMDTSFGNIFTLSGGVAPANTNADANTSTSLTATAGGPSTTAAAGGMGGTLTATAGAGGASTGGMGGTGGMMTLGGGAGGAGSTTNGAGGNVDIQSGAGISPAAHGAINLTIGSSSGKGVTVNNTGTFTTLNSGSIVPPDNQFQIQNHLTPSALAQFNATGLSSGTTIFTFPTTAGTLADSATTPVNLDLVTGIISITGVAGEVLAGGAPAFTATPQLGIAASLSGSLGLANGGTSGAIATVQNPSATSNYNFNLPIAAGAPGLPLLSGGGGSAPMTFGPLGVPGGGTGSTTFAANSILLGNGTSVLNTLSCGAGTILQGASAGPPTCTLTPQLGVSGSGGTIQLFGTTSGSTTIVPAASSSYSFNLPTSAGALGQPLLSGAGSAAMTFGTLSVSGGGTGLPMLNANNILIGNGTSNLLSLSCGAGTVLQGVASAPPTCTQTPQLGTSGSGGTIQLFGASSGSTTIVPPAAASSVGNGVPVEIFHTSSRHNNSTGPIQMLASANIVTTGLYRFSGYITQFDTGTGCSGNAMVAVTLSYEDGLTSNTIIPALALDATSGARVTALTLSFANTTGTTSQAALPPFSFFAKSGVDISYSTTYTNGTCTTTQPNYQIFPILEAL